MHKTQTSGFTLIEILVVISIIGILAALLLANMAGIRGRAADAKLKNNMTQFRTALRYYYNENQSYPPTPGDSKCATIGLSTSFIDAAVIPNSNPNICYYARTGTGDSFYAYVQLNSDAGTEDSESATACGQPVTQGVYYVCSN